MSTARDAGRDWRSAAMTIVRTAIAVLPRTSVLLTGRGVVLTRVAVVLTGISVVLTRMRVVLTGANVVLTGIAVVLTGISVVLTGTHLVLTWTAVVLTGIVVVLTKGIAGHAASLGFRDAFRGGTSFASSGAELLSRPPSQAGQTG
jgi:hypothetical protein